MKSTLDQTFDTFKEWLMNKFAATYSPAGSTYINANAYNQLEKDGEYMLMHYDYAPECEEFLIKWAKFFIEVKLDHTQSHNISTAFLEKLMNKMAAYLSYYASQKYPMPATAKSQNKLRIKVQMELKAILFDDNDYITRLKDQQSVNRGMRQQAWKKRKQFIATKKRLERQNAYQRTCEIRREIDDLFDDAQRTPRYR